MSLKNVDFDSVFRRLADKRIEDAMKEGKFDNLRGAGQPIDLEPLPADENVRMTWWALRILRNNDYVPEEVRWRKTVDKLKDELRRLTDERPLARLVAQVNALVHKINTLGTNALKAGVAPVDLETERARLRERLSG
jgi:hypothetical protein